MFWLGLGIGLALGAAGMLGFIYMKTMGNP
jgi:hypothetical protein